MPSFHQGSSDDEAWRDEDESALVAAGMMERIHEWRRLEGLGTDSTGPTRVVGSLCIQALLDRLLALENHGVFC